jgi:hypothetical protein
MFASVSEIYVFFHYGVMPPMNKGMFFSIIDIFRLFLFYLLCFYYTDKASGLLKSRNRNLSKSVLTTVMIVGLSLITGFGIFLVVRIN